MTREGVEPIPRRLLLTRLADGKCPCITRARGRSLAEAASYCLLNNERSLIRILEVVGDFPAKFALRRLDVTGQMSRMLADRQEATEDGGAAIAVLLVEELTSWKAVFRSPKGSGVDYWLSGRDSEDLAFEARLECSGLLDGGGESKRKQRVRAKLKQTESSDDTGLPAVVIVVDFRDMVAEVVQKS